MRLSNITYLYSILFFCLLGHGAFIMLFSTYNVGQGAQAGVSVSAKNHYLISGLIDLQTSDPRKMAVGAKDYKVNI
jgi:hypothetical protein